MPEYVQEDFPVLIFQNTSEVFLAPDFQKEAWLQILGAISEKLILVSYVTWTCFLPHMLHTHHLSIASSKLSVPCAIFLIMNMTLLATSRNMCHLYFGETKCSSTLSLEERFQ